MGQENRRSGRWSFRVGVDGLWTWTHEDVQGHALGRCNKPFRTMQECLLDAAANGFRRRGHSGKPELRVF
jgi:hypothetical protein